jgi:kynurenine--oxoglutarate transaminase/cysteine-S-conjugate beta-lyase/glutamine--phenylpyruvate transaminase
MWDRTLTISSSGKTFSCTGWKLGWLYGDAKLIKPVMLANQWIQFSVSTPTQVAMADILEHAEQPYEGFSSYFAYIRDVYEKKRNFLLDVLRISNLPPYVPEGGFFIISDTTKLQFPDLYLEQSLPSGQRATRDWGFAR